MPDPRTQPDASGPSPRPSAASENGPPVSAKCPVPEPLTELCDAAPAVPASASTAMHGGTVRTPAANRPRGMISTHQVKHGAHIEVDGTVFKIVEFQHVKPGKGGAFVRTKLKRADDGAVIDKTFRAGEKFRPVRTESRKMTFLYSDGTDAHFMDTQTYEQMAVPQDAVAESLKWVVPNEEVDMLYVDDAPSDVQVPSAVELSVTETEPGVRGDTASGGGDKPATLESGVIVRVPLFVNGGDRIRVDTRSGEYVSRA